MFTRPIVFVGVALLLAGGVQLHPHADVAVPRGAVPCITVIADAGQQSIDHMMITVTKPIESAVKKVPDVTTVKSSTGRGSCVVDIYFHWGTDIYAQKAQVESRTHSRIALRDVANLIVRPMFSQVDGISNVVVRGGKAKEYVVKTDAAKMTALPILLLVLPAAMLRVYKKDATNE